ncbi:MAG TPA: hypothetical protein PK919_12410 [Candidatus Aminicenantes bacterium]|nr:hypothetical protein [Candidatus Aminicenantes bacterium]
MEHKIELKVNGRTIAMNPFVRRIIGNVVLGAVGSLDRVPQPWKKIVITLQAAKQDKRSAKKR